MHLCFFIGRMSGCGGAEKVISTLSHHYIEKGWRVSIVLLLSGMVDREQYKLDERIKIVDLSGKYQSYFRNALSWIKAIRRYVNKEKPNCLISFVGRINALVLTATLGIKVPIVVSERNDPLHDGRSRLMIEYCKFIYRCADRAVFQTRYQRVCFSSLDDDKCCIIPNPLYVVDQESVRINELEISSAGRLTEQKNQEMLIDAVGLLINKYPDIQCEIYGDGRLHDQLQEKISTMGLSGNVHLCGNKTDLFRWVVKSRIFVLTSDYEGLSNALMEAMMMGKICISSDYPGVEDLIDDGINGFIVRRNDAKGLAERMDKIFSEPACSAVVGANARKKSEEYSYEGIMSKWDEVIQGVCEVYNIYPYLDG